MPRIRIGQEATTGTLQQTDMVHLDQELSLYSF